MSVRRLLQPDKSTSLLTSSCVLEESVVEEAFSAKSGQEVTQNKSSASGVMQTSSEGSD